MPRWNHLSITAVQGVGDFALDLISTFIAACGKPGKPLRNPQGRKLDATVVREPSLHALFDHLLLMC